MAIRIKATDQHRNVAYIHNQYGGWRCTLANGTPASFSYAGIDTDEMALIFDLNATTDEAGALAAVMRHARRYGSGPQHGATVYSYSIPPQCGQARNASEDEHNAIWAALTMLCHAMAKPSEPIPFDDVREIFSDGGGLSLDDLWKLRDSFSDLGLIFTGGEG